MFSDSQAISIRGHERQSARTITNDVAIILGFISYYIPMKYAINPIIRTTWQMSAMVTSSIAILKLVYSRRMNRRNASGIFYYLWLFLGTRFLGGNFPLTYCIGFFLICGGFFAYLDYLMQTRSAKTVVKYFLIAGIIMSFIHFASYLSDTVGNTWYFLKHDNGSIYFFIQIMVLLLYYSVFWNGRVIIYFTAYSAFVVYMFYDLMSATAIVSSTYLAGVLVYLYLKRKRRKNIPRVLYSCKFTLYAGIMGNIIPLLIVGSVAVSGIVEVLGKDITFSGRSLIWARSMVYFMSSPFFGIGVYDGEATAARIGINHCHNLVVENLFIGGIVLFFLFLLMLKMYFPPKPDKYKCAIFCAGMMSFFITSAFDWYYYYPLPFSMIIFNYYLSRGEVEARKKSLPAVQRRH